MEIIYEDDSVLIVSKPAGQIVNRAETTKGAKTLQDELEERFGIKRPEDGVGGRAGIVHRLDKGTSGVLVVAKTEEAFEGLQAQFKQRKVKKEYLTLVRGKVKEKNGRIDAPIGRNPKNRMRFAVVKDGRQAVTEYSLLHYNTTLYDSEEFSYLRVKLLTGRTHQIRVHMKHIGHPVVADPLYLSRKQLKKDRQWCPRMFLHAERLGIKHPETGAWMRFEAELPEDLKSALDYLKTA
jgi:23S rRNA pseudouridine1911/1915/1917 synthase